MLKLPLNIQNHKHLLKNQTIPRDNLFVKINIIFSNLFLNNGTLIQTMQQSISKTKANASAKPMIIFNISVITDI